MHTFHGEFCGPSLRWNPVTISKASSEPDSVYYRLSKLEVDKWTRFFVCLFFVIVAIVLYFAH